MSVDGPSQLQLHGRAFLDIDPSFVFPAHHAPEVSPDGAQPTRFGAGARTVHEPGEELNPSSTDPSYQNASTQSQPTTAASSRRLPSAFAIPAASLKVASRVAVRPADVLAQEVEHLGQSLFVSEFLQFRGAPTQACHGVSIRPPRIV